MKKIALLIPLISLMTFYLPKNLGAKEVEVLLTNNGNGNYQNGLAVEKNGRLNVAPWDKSVKINFSDDCFPSEAVYRYPDGAPDFRDQGPQYMDPECTKLTNGKFEAVIWQFNTDREKTIEFDLKKEYKISKIVLYSYIWSGYGLDHISFYLKESGDWHHLENKDLEGYPAHEPTGYGLHKADCYYFAAKDINENARYVKIGLRNNDNKNMIMVNQVEIWGYVDSSQILSSGLPAGELIVTRPPIVLCNTAVDGAPLYTFFNDRMQITINPDNGAIEEVKGFGQELLSEGRFGVSFSDAEESVFQDSFTNRNVKWNLLPKTEGTFSIQATAKTEADLHAYTKAKELPVQIDAGATKKGSIFLKMVLNDSAMPATPPSAVFQARISGKTYIEKKLVVNGKEYAYPKEGSAKPVLEVQNPKFIMLDTYPTRSVSFLIKTADKLSIQPSQDGWIFKLTSKTGKLEFYLQPPYPTFETKLSTQMGHNVFDLSEANKLDINLRVKNLSPKARKASVRYLITDYYGDTILEKEEQVALASDELLSRTISPRPNELGFYALRLAVTDQEEKTTFSDFLTFGIIKAHSLEKPFSPKDRFGTHGGLFLSTLAKKIGMGWSRDCYAEWTYGEPQPGVYSVAIDGVKEINKHNLGELAYDGGYRPWAEGPATDPKSVFANRPICKDLEAYRRWREKVSQGIGNLAAGFEVCNEIYGVDPANCVATHKIAYQEAKKVNPNLPVAANVVVGTWGGRPEDDWTIEYLRKFLELGGKDACDVIAMHPYTDGISQSPEAKDMVARTQAVREVIKKYGKGQDIWWTEWGFHGEDFRLDQDIPHGEFESYRETYTTERNQAHYCVRSHLAGLAAGVKVMFYFLIGGHREDEPGFMWPEYMTRLEGIRPVVCAYATMTRMLNDPDFAGEAKSPANTRAYLFKDKDTRMAVYWYYPEDELSGKIFLPLKPKDIEVINIMGNPVELKTNQKRLELPIDGGPRYLTSKTLTVEQLSEAFGNAQTEGLTSLDVRNMWFTPGLAAFKVAIQNNGPGAAKGVITLESPPEWKVTNSRAEFGPVDEEKSFTASFPVGNKELQENMPYNIHLFLSNSKKQIFQELSFIFARRLTSPVKIDGNLDEWKNPAIVLNQREQTSDCMTRGITRGGPSWKGPEDLSSKIYLAWDKEYFYVAVDVLDDKFCQEGYTKEMMWKSDSIQVGMDLGCNAVPKKGWDKTDDYELCLGLREDGPAVFNPTFPDDFRGTISNKTKVAIKRKGNHTIYEMAFPFEALSPLEPEAGCFFGFNLMVNDDDGAGRKGWIGITEGLGAGKFPELFRKVLLVGTKE